MKQIMQIAAAGALALAGLAAAADAGQAMPIQTLGATAAATAGIDNVWFFHRGYGYGYGVRPGFYGYRYGFRPGFYGYRRPFGYGYGYGWRRPFFGYGWRRW